MAFNPGEIDPKTPKIKVVGTGGVRGSRIYLLIDGKEINISGCVCNYVIRHNAGDIPKVELDIIAPAIEAVGELSAVQFLHREFVKTEEKK